MTFADIYTAVKNIRFDASLVTAFGTGGIKDWVRACEAEVWRAADWPIKDSVQLTLPIVSGTATAAVPSGFSNPAQGLSIFDDFGDELTFLEPHEFFQAYGARPAAPISNQRPEAWTLVFDPTLSSSNDLLFRVGPTPNITVNFTVQGWNLPIKRTAATTWAIGTMSADTDLPWWPDDYHYGFVDGPLAMGKRQYGDPTWQGDRQAFTEWLASLVSELSTNDRGPVEIWGEC